jgi:EmrB/QacA subfamily drug resistance transporter
MAELSAARKLLVLAICCMSLLIVGLDSTIVNVALPAIRADLHTNVSGLQWVVDAYTLVLGSLLMLSGSTADRIGRRRTFQIGLVTFTLGSLLCSLAPSLQLLVVFRIVQAIGGSMLNPVAMSIITNVFTEPRERARAIGVWSGVIGLSMALGPVVGGAIIGPVGWQGIFWINVPIGVAAIVLAALFVPESRAERPRRVDPVGQLLMIVLLAALTFGIIEGPHRGWASAEIVGVFALAVLALLGILLYEPRRDQPLLDLRFFRSVPFAGATLIAVSAFSGLGGFLLLNTLYLQSVRGMSPLDAGLMMLPMAGMTVVAGPFSGRLLGTKGPRLPLACAGVALTVAGMMLTRLSPGTSLGWIFAAYMVFGLGFAMVNPPITNTAVSGMPLTQAGVAAATASTSRQVGSSLGVAICGAFLSTASAGPSGLARAAVPGWWVVAGGGALVLLLGIVTTTSWARATAARTAARLMPEPERTPVAT